MSSVSDDSLEPLSIAEVVAQLTCADGTRTVSEDQVKRYLRDKVWPGRKIGHKWVMTRSDLRDALEIHYSAPRTPAPLPTSGLSPRSRSRLARP